MTSRAEEVQRRKPEPEEVQRRPELEEVQRRPEPEGNNGGEGAEEVPEEETRTRGSPEETRLEEVQRRPEPEGNNGGEGFCSEEGVASNSLEEGLAGRSFREEQCWSFNSQLYGGRSYQWKPLYPGDYVHISSNPCDLHCTTADSQRQLMVAARDGTSCKYSSYRGVCVDGKCEPIGCDGVLFSPNVLDKCGVCQGDGSSCSRITGNFRRGTATLGTQKYFYCHVWNQNGRVPYITYEYTILRHAISPVAPPPLYTGPDSSAGGLSVELGGLQGPNSSLFHQGPPLGQEEGVASNSLEEGLGVTTWWGEWAKWSACTRTCGGGVMSQERHCLRQRKKVSAGKDNMNCTGTAKQYHLCNTKDCPPAGRSFREEQCWSFNSQLYGGRSYQWKPLYPVTRATCHCTTADSQRQLMVAARDGTSCKYSSYRGVCVDGKCEPIGCDGVLFLTQCPGQVWCVSGGWQQLLQNHWKLPPWHRHLGPQNFHAAGTVFKYRRPTDVYETGIEYIVAKGPVDQPINILVWNQNGRVPYITYEYTILRHAISPVAPPPLYTGPDSSAGGLSVELGGLQGPNSSLFHQGPPLGQAEAANGEETNEVYEETTGGIPCEQDGAAAPSCAEVNSSLPVLMGPDSQNLIWRVLLGERIGPDELLINISTNQLLAEGEEAGLVELERREGGSFNETLEFTIGRKRNDSEGHTPNRTLTGQRIPGPRNNRTRGNQKNQRVSPADMYRWKLSTQEPCSMTCSIGVSRALAMCVRYDGTEVDDVYCDALTRPQPVHDFCIARECQPRMLSPGLDSSVYSDLCTLAELERPPERRACKSHACGAQWEVAEWGECPAKCGRRAQVNREVRCSDEDRPCDLTTKPPNTKNCTGPPWSCGQGRMTRHVYCKTPQGRVVPETQCSQEDKPLAVHPCGEKDCRPHWLNQDWERCNTTCGRGVKRRVVLCAGITGGKFQMFEDEACSDGEKPGEEDTCFERPCFKWYTTPWSECTKTCGVGVRMRDVKCYQARELVRGCDPMTKPVAKQTCALQPCPTEPPDESCQDRPTTNCTLALKVNLCSHWYYSKACCHSCRP
ncbi:hypothetical protein CRUP_001664, partial [Coryphaenoides rupestris]